MTDDELPHSHAGETDASKLDRSAGRTGRPGDVFPPDEPLAVEDPNIRADGSIAPDDVDTRDQRERPERATRPD